MRIDNLTEHSNVYTSNVYLVRGTWNALSDMNTLIDVGRDISIIHKINNMSTGVGKRKIDQVVLTHSHYDHGGILKQICEAFHPKVYVFSESVAYVDFHVRDGESIKIGDRNFEVIHAPFHSNDSICLFCKKEKLLFVGDTPVIIKSTDGSYTKDFYLFLENLCSMEIESIYFGHGAPLTKDCNLFLTQSLRNIEHALKIRGEYIKILA